MVALSSRRLPHLSLLFKSLPFRQCLGNLVGFSSWKMIGEFSTQNNHCEVGKKITRSVRNTKNKKYYQRRQYENHIWYSTMKNMQKNMKILLSFHDVRICVKKYILFSVYRNKQSVVFMFGKKHFIIFNHCPKNLTWHEDRM